MSALLANDMVSPNQAAQLLGLSVARVRQLADAGTLAVTSTALGRLFDRADVERLARERDEGRRAAHE